VPGQPDATSTNAALAEIQKLMAMQSGMTEQFMNASIPEPTNFASVEVQVPDEPAQGTNGQAANGQAAHADGQSNGASEGQPEAKPAPGD
jgi:hypothetical protein